MKITASCKQSLVSLGEVLYQMDRDYYSKKLTLLNGATVGQHVRHILEFYSCLFEQLPTGTVNYDLRKRDLTLENSLDVALTKLNETIAILSTLIEDVAIQLRQVAIDGELITVNTNLYRELIYQMEHTIHHVAIIRIALNEIDHEITLPEDFGVAPSTLRYRQSISLPGH